MNENLKLSPINCANLVNNALKSINGQLDQKQINNSVKYMEYLLEWNSKINLISRKSEEFVLSTGFIESYSLYEFLLNFDGRMLDVGTGGGIPGMFQSIFFQDNPDCHFTLIDSIAKKTMVLKDINTKLKLKNLDIFNTRLEDVSAHAEAGFDLIFSRGVGSFDQLIKAYFNALSDDGVLVFLTGIDQAESLCFKDAKIFENPYLDNRLLIIMEKE
jgi:16S rRNA (guanine527-N7)-methyltransferase